MNDQLSELSMYVVKANIKDGEMRIRMTSSDTGKDLYDEEMSSELFDDFLSHIQNNEPIPPAFESVVAEPDWNGGMPYISLAHYKSGAGRVNVPGEIKSIYRDGKTLKAVGVLHDTPLGRAVFKSLQKDLVEKRDDKIRVSIGFLDTQHSHGNKYTFTRKSISDKCHLCKEKVGDKIYKKGHLVHLALTRVPANPRTDVEVERSMTTKREDAASIVEDEEVLKGLDLKSQATDVLVIKAVPEGCPCKEGDQECIDDWKEDQKDGGKDEATENTSLVEDSTSDNKDAKGKYGDVTYADAKNKKYPIDTEEHVRAALSYWGMPKNRASYSPEEQKTIGNKIHAAAKKFNIAVSEKSSAEENTVLSEENPIQKSFAVLAEKIVSVKSQGLTGDAALQEIQAEFDHVGEVIKSEFTPKPSPEEIAAKTMETTLRSLLAEMLPAALAQTVAPIQSKLETLEGELRAKSLTTVSPKEKVETVQRSLTPSLVQKSAIEGIAKKSMSQIQMLANQSVGLQ